MSILYSVKEGLAGFQRARFAAVASTLSIAIALTLLGAFGLIGYHAEQVRSHIQEQSSQIEVFLNDPNTEVAESVSRVIGRNDGVLGTTIVSQEEAERIFIEDFGEAGDIFLDESFLPASIKVRVAQSHVQVDSLTKLASLFSRHPNVDDAKFERTLLTQVQENVKLLTLVAVVVGILVLVTALFLVANTIRLTIYARRLLIRTMKLVGATNNFIRRPFVFEGIIQGIVGGVISGLFVWLIHAFLRYQVPLLEARPWPGGSPLLTLVGLVVLGALLGWLGSVVAVRRFIRDVRIQN